MRARGTGIIIVGCLLAATACSSHDTTHDVRPAPQVTGNPNTAPSTLPRVTPHGATTSTLPERSRISFAVTARNPTISLYAAPNATTPKPQVLPNPWVVDPSRPNVKSQQVFLVAPGGFVPGWLHVLLPVQPNGITAWVRSRDALIRQIPYRVLVEL